MKKVTSSSDFFPDQDTFFRIQELMQSNKEIDPDQDFYNAELIEQEKNFREDLLFVIKNNELMEINDMLTSIRNEHTINPQKIRPEKTFKTLRFPILGFIFGLVVTFSIFLMIRENLFKSANPIDVQQNQFKTSTIVQENFDYNGIPIMELIIIFGEPGSEQAEKTKTYYENKNYQEAILAFNEFKKESLQGPSDPEDTDLIDFYIGICELKLENTNRAEKIFNSLSTKEGFFLIEEANFYLGIVKYIKGDFQSAKTCFDLTNDSDRILLGDKKLSDVSKSYLTKIGYHMSNKEIN